MTSSTELGSESGFSIFEVLIGATILAVALLGHTASIFSEHKMSEAERARKESCERAAVLANLTQAAKEL